MKTSHIAAFLVLTVAAAARHLQKRDWVPPLDWARCDELERQCKNNLSVVGEILNGQGLSTLISGGALTIDCSPSRLAANHRRMREVGGICRSNLDIDVLIYTNVYKYICTNSQAFIQAEGCLGSRILSETRRRCHISSRDYEAKCREEPVCIQTHLSNTVECSLSGATPELMGNMTRLQYNSFLDNCHYLME
ncbi:uncharacterized protein LOC124267608 isoform X2 [Haliotis rubra]|uniref:uncharacterized protein LOC124267608 isoform X2 n=1 Tax=Haliotis rubra TaxID=36100 RepID=UPI001EE62EE6|nr:uncharacterized protein LOC124267608 isoform X2 [Haliotis rubra]